MEIKILAFGIAKDILGHRKISMDLPERSTVADLRAQLTNQFPSFDKLRSLRFALEQEYVADDQPLRPQDEVIIIPPVSGG